MALIDAIEQKSFLGPEFLTWLWYRAETSSDASIDLGDGRTCFVEFDRDLILTSEAGEATASTLRGDAPSLAPEAAAALCAGKKVKRARLRLGVGEATYELALDAEGFDWRGLKIDVPTSLPLHEALPLRLNALEEFHTVFTALFDNYLDLRLDTDVWKAEEKAMRAWARDKSSEGGTD